MSTFYPFAECLHLLFLSLLIYDRIQVCQSSICIQKLDHVWYDPDYQICCGGNLQQRTTNLKCCNGDLYFSHDQICCNGKLSNRFGAGHLEMMCCGDKSYPKEDNIFCCDGVYQELQDGIDPARVLCCGKKLLVSLGSQGYSCCDGSTFDPNEKMCVNGIKLEKTHGFCNGDHYDRMKDMCCQGHLIENVPEFIEDETGVLHQNLNAQCCGPNIMDNDRNCCEERLYGTTTHTIPKHTDLKCCGSGFYNYTKQYCVSGTAIDKSPYNDVCGAAVYDKRSHLCCANNIPYDNSTQKCCEGVGYCVVDKDKDCCNGLEMKDDEICCEGIKPCKKREQKDDECCYDHERDNGNSYKKGEKWTCSKGKLLFIPDGNYLPCGKDYFNPESHFCCNGNTHEHGSGQCCHGFFSNIPKMEGRCCIDDNKAYKFGDMNNPCIKQCDERTYDYSYELCCAGRVYSYTGNNYCCGPYAINPFLMGCCGDQFAYRLNGSKKCCKNTQTYNTKHFTCRADGKLESKGELKGLSDTQKVCHHSATKFFDGGVQQTCLCKYGITGKIKSATVITLKSGNYIKIDLKSVRSLKRGLTLPKRIIFRLHIGSVACQVDHLKPSSRAIVLFDSELKGRRVEILKDSPFFINPKTFIRHYSVTKAISRSLCKTFS